MEPLTKKEFYTVEEWLSWDEDVRAELHDGVLVMLAQPNIRHQRILIELATHLHTFLKGKQCEVFPAPVGVRLNKSEQTAFEPDIIVVCDKSKLDGGKICNGAPDMVIEILSPSTARYDRGYKYKKYQQAGVREYWIVDPDLKLLQACVLHKEGYVNTIYEPEDTAPVSVLSGCEISLADIFVDDE